MKKDFIRQPPIAQQPKRPLEMQEFMDVAQVDMAESYKFKGEQESDSGIEEQKTPQHLIQQSPPVFKHIVPKDGAYCTCQADRF